MEDNLKKIKMEDELKKKEKMEKKTKIFSQFLPNLGAKLSWGWLSYLRFFII